MSGKWASFTAIINNQNNDIMNTIHQEIVYHYFSDSEFEIMTKEQFIEEFNRNNYTMQLISLVFSRNEKQYVAKWKIKGYEYNNVNTKLLGNDLRFALNNWLGLNTFFADIEFVGSRRSYLVKKAISAKTLGDAYHFLKIKHPIHNLYLRPI